MNPLSALHGAGVAVRNSLYDRGVLRSRRLSRSVISVGSISAGGAGKTPFVILLGKLLRARGIAFDVLSRGYGRDSEGALVVDPNGSPRQFGDEPLLIARRLECPVIVGESRYEAGSLGERSFKSQFHILDDGFQHRSLARDFDIVLLTAEDVSDRLLPFGRLREPLASLKRADAVVWIDDEYPDEVPIAHKPVWHVRRDLQLDSVPKNPVVFCGIARPQRFFEQLKTVGVTPLGSETFRDHHAYSGADVRGLLALRDRLHADGFVTTEKDVVNLGGLLNELGEVAVARVEMKLAEPADALDSMLRGISERADGREKIRADSEA